jgi:hypothetical protein
MGSDGSRRLKIGMPGAPAPRRWPSSLLAEELSLETLQDTTYVRLMHQEHVAISLCDAEGFEVSPKGTRSEKAWSWLKRKPEVPVVQVMTKSKSTHNVMGPWLVKAPGDEFQFDPSKRWPQGW